MAIVGRRLHRPVDGVLPRRDRPVAADRGARARDRRLRRVRPQRRLVLGAVPARVAAGIARRHGAAGRRRRCAARCTRRSTRSAAWPTPRASTPTTRAAARSRWRATRRSSPGPRELVEDARRLTGPVRGARAARRGGGRGHRAAPRACSARTYTPHCAAIHPRGWCAGWPSAVERRGVTIYERTARPSIAAGCGARTDRGTVRAEVVVRATEGYTPSLRGERRRARARSTR